ncbi:hypothetical protein [Humibacter ginsenosidimutans]|uniref:Uncharacterized protein n=1 Tax=Humibacter ginsenosidimutans TaxID=2599293 RepID=A0A5B8M5H0_9MICO|nr:hypothetical protein [Humibacter ginsenosidimutans]QDZ15441.1 hypothetical protein FPZ11_12345 [Humibacter ginsenosidimutans]
MDFLIQVLAGIASTVLGTLLVTLILAKTSRAKWNPVKVAATNGRGGTQVIVGDALGGDVSVGVDNSRQIIVKNIQSSRQSAPSVTKENEGTWQFWVAVVIAVVAASLFVIYERLVLWFVIGMAVGLAITLIAAVVRANRIHSWDRRSASVTAEVVLSLAAIVWSCVSVSTLRFAGETVAGLGRRVSEAAAADPGSTGANAVTKAVVEPAKQLVVLGFANGQLTFAIMMMGAVVLSLLLAAAGCRSLYDWLAFMGFFFGTTTKGQVAKGAARFEARTAKSMLATMIVCALVFLLASGWLMTIVHPTATLPFGR